jgi:hypothetical protein
MNEDAEKLMLEHGITAETRIVFRFRGYRYERLSDAVAYARVTAGRSKGEGDEGSKASETIR